MDAVWGFVEGSGFMPHAHCYLWKPELMLLHGGSDLVIGLAYMTIPVTMFWVVQRRRDVPYRSLFLAFVAFILACGTGHLLEVITLWSPIYWLSGTSKAVTAVVSVATALLLVRAAPGAVRAPSAADLRRAQDRFRAVADGSADGFFLVRESQGSFLVEYANSAGLKLAGVHSMVEVEGKSLDRMLLGAGDSTITRVKTEAWSSGETRFEELDVHLANGQAATLQLQVVPIEGGVGVTVRDVTARRRDAAELRQLAEVVRSTRDAVITGDAEFRVRTWNPGAEELLGIPAQEAVSNTIFSEIVPQADQAQTQQEYQLALQGTYPPIRETFRLSRSGRSIPVSMQLSPVLDDRGAVIGACAILRDLTTSRQAAELKAAVAEREVLLHEIHHRVKNDLQLVSSLLRRARRKLPSEAEPVIRLAIERIQTIALVHDQLYASPSLHRVELADYIEVLVGRLRGLTLDSVVVMTELEAVEVTGGVAIAAGLMAHELVVNAFEHAFPGRSGGVVRVRLELDGPDKITLSVEDDGVPLALGSVKELALLFALADQVGGVLQTTEGSPKRVSVTFPKVGERERAK